MDVWCCWVEKYECHYFWMENSSNSGCAIDIEISSPWNITLQFKKIIIQTWDHIIYTWYGKEIFCTVAPIHVISYSKALNPLVSQNIEGTSISRLTQTPLPGTGKKMVFV